MAKIILCTGRLAENGWALADGRRVYSVEELCCYVYENITGIDREFFSPELAAWLASECGLPDTAEKLLRLKEEGHGIRDLTVALLCSADYYTEEEILLLIRQLKELDNMPVWKRRRQIAGDWQQKGYLTRAILGYEQILAECELTGEEKAVLYHDIGVARIHMSDPAEAAESFYLAYRLDHRWESLKQCLLAYRLGGYHQRYRQIRESEQVSEEQIRELEEAWEAAAAEAEQSRSMEQLRSIIRQREQGMEAVAEEKLDRLLEDWMQEYRKSIVR